MRPRTLMAGVAAGIVVASLFSAPAANAAANSIVTLPISFHVQNTNKTDVHCQSDGKDYTARGIVVGPKSAIQSGDAATLYLHAVTWNANYFNLNIPGHNFAQEMAKKGHVSIAVDRLGYGSSDKPDGEGTCFGSAADVAHQMVDALKSGDYAITGAKKAAYKKVFLSGSSVGGMIANTVAYTFHNVDGVYNQSFGDFSAGPFAGYEAVDVNERCYKGGDPNGRPHYATFAGDARDMFWFGDAPQNVRDSVPPMQQDPCGEMKSLPFAIGADMQHLGEINVPVLLTFGDADPVFPMGSAEQMQFRYSGSPAVTNVSLAGAAHYPILDTAFPQMVDAVDAWLSKLGG
ncbi:MAG TPA: alpha/beta fold hydrolase [Sporichthya sp.]|nr:alpha/beta fold hydrolase [Sporichthya sp.]